MAVQVIVHYWYFPSQLVILICVISCHALERYAVQEDVIVCT